MKPNASSISESSTEPCTSPRASCHTHNTEAKTTVGLRGGGSFGGPCRWGPQQLSGAFLLPQNSTGGRPCPSSEIKSRHMKTGALQGIRAPGGLWQTPRPRPRCPRGEGAGGWPLSAQVLSPTAAKQARGSGWVSAEQSQDSHKARERSPT